MSIGLRLLLSDYERARAVGDKNRVNSIFKQMEKIGLPDHLKSKPQTRRAKPKAKGSQPQTNGTTSEVKIDPGRF
jgi:hypothetical protein